MNKLKPYATWQALSEEARTLWGIYADIAHPDSIGRIALRYINRLELPLPIADFKEYVRTRPDIADDMPHGVTALFMRLEIPYPTGVIAIITETLEPVEKREVGSVLPFILDIDVVRQGNLSPGEVGGLWGAFAQLRDIKNEIFFNSITPKAEQLFR